MDTKIINKAKSKVKDNIKITKETDEKIYFEVNSFKGSYNKSMKPQAPQWFKDFDEKNDARWEKQEKFNSEVVSFIKNQEKFNSEIKSSIQGINTRIDNLVTKNKLTE